MTKNVYWVLKATIGEGNLEPLKNLAQRFCEATQSEEGVIAYEWSVSDDESTLHILERFADSTAALTHLENVGPILPELMALATPTVMECYGAIDDNFREATKRLPMSYTTMFAGFHR